MKLFYPVLFAFLFIYHSSALCQNIVINEIMSSNSSVISDDDGDFSDWIELYNAGTSNVQLQGWGLSDNYSYPFKWVFPEYSIQPGEYLLIWASGKDRAPEQSEWVNGLMREVYMNITGSSINSLIQHANYPDKPDSRQLLRGKFEAPMNVADNYGQRIHGLIKAPATGSFTFWIASDDAGRLMLSSDENPQNLEQIAEVPGWTHSREWEKYPEQKSAPVFLEEGKYYYIMALMKEAYGGDNLAVRWQWPDGTMDAPIMEEHLFWTGAAPFHTNFSISSDGEEIILTDITGELIDEIPPVKIPTNLSYGRALSGNQLLYFNQPTPGKANSETGFNEILGPPVFSHQGGFYSAPFELIINTSEPDVTIIYTLDGSDPSSENLSGKNYYYKNQFRKDPGSSAGPFLARTLKSHTYTAPIDVYNRTEEENQISSISTTYDNNPWYLPNYPVDKAVVVKAIAVKEGAMPSEPVSHTFFVNDNGQNPFSLPVFSLAAQENYLFDYESGIYTAGKVFEDWRTANPDAEANGGVSANYHRRGVVWEYPASLEYFESNGEKIFGQNIGFRIHGGWSRAASLKSLRLYARNEYGQSHFNHAFFKDQDYSSYKRLALRNSGNDYWYTFFRDAAMQEMIKHMNMETQAYQPSVLFLNGEYWGIHNIRERIDKHFLARKFGISNDQIDLLQGNMGVVEGNNSHYAETMNYINQNGLANNEHYNYIKTRISTESYIDYMLSQIYLVNTDWPGNNIKYWRYQTEQFQPEAGPGKDGRWRWIVFDTDFGFGIYNHSSFTTNMLEFSTNDVGNNWPNPQWSTLLFRKLLENTQFQTEFITRFCDQLNTAFLPDVIKSVITSIKEGVEPDMEQHIQRWRNVHDMNAWNNRVNVMLNFADQRPEYARNHLREFFALESDYNLMVNVSDASQGNVKVNTIPLLKETRGVDENPYPWNGTYFRKMPLRLEAIPEKGYEFIRWESNSMVYEEPVLELIPDEDQAFTAIFQKAARTDQLVHYWNFNNTEALLTPTYTLISAGLHAALPSEGESEITSATGQGFSGINARFSDDAGSHLRVNFPLDVSLTFDLPTTSFSKIKFSYETRRSGQGAGTQIIEYSSNGINYVKFQELTILDDDPRLIAFDFSEIEAVNNNPDFKIRITFAQGEGGIAGNNRFDNITLEGIPDEGVNLPPVVLSYLDDFSTIEGDEDITLNLNELFDDPENDPLNYSITSVHQNVIGVTTTNGLATLSPVARGESVITISADDGNNPPAEIRFRILVYPKAFELANANFSFTYWDENATEMTFPENMLFLQSNMDDPSTADPLDFAYYIPEEEYADEDAGNLGFPYRNTRRTRINGLGEEGISFINTGRGRDLGGALLAINTTGLDEIQAEWLAGTLLRNSRQYGLQLQYRLGTSGEFTILPVSQYIAETDGHLINKGPYALPHQLLNQEYVQLLWRYHYLSGTSGPRSQLRLDDILIAARPPAPEITYPHSETPIAGNFNIQWTVTERTEYYELQIAEDSDFQNLIVSVQNITEPDYQQNALETGKNYYIRVRAINAITVSNWSETVAIYEPVTSVEMPENLTERLKVYPNPFSHSIKLELNLAKTEKIDIGLFDLSGRKLLAIYQGVQFAGENHFVIDAGHLPSGTYVLICRTDSEIYREKLVKQ